MNQRLEQYLGEAEQKLQGLPEARRKEELEEMRQHLTASVEAHEELGLDTASATEESICQFGALQQISSGLQKAWWREQIGGPRGLWKTVALAIALRYVLSGLLSPVTSLATYATSASSRGHAWDSSISLLCIACLLAFNALPSIVAGIAVGRTAPRNAVPGTAIATGIQLSVALLNCAVILACVSNVQIAGGWWMTAAREMLCVLFMISAAWLTVRHEHKRLSIAQ